MGKEIMTLLPSSHIAQYAVAIPSDDELQMRPPIFYSPGKERVLPPTHFLGTGVFGDLNRNPSGTLRASTLSEKMSPFLSRLTDLVRLPEKWDSYEARQIDRDVIVAALGVIHHSISLGAPAPSIVPTNNGGVQIEWHENGVDLEIDIISPHRFEVVFEDLISEETHDIVVTYDWTELDSFIKRLSKTST